MLPRREGKIVRNGEAVKERIGNGSIHGIFKYLQLFIAVDSFSPSPILPLAVS
jgi:hypothetical protein